jgi:streptogramin lyase
MRSWYPRPTACFVAAVALALTSCSSGTTEPDGDLQPDPPLGAGLRTRMYVHDVNGYLATIDVATGVVTLVGNMGVQMRDIAFDDQARLFAIAGEHVSILDTLTATLSVVGEHGLNLPNALAASTDGTLYVASPTNTLLHTLNPVTGVATLVGDMGHASEGDMAFHNGWLYMTSAAGQLIRVNTASPEESVVVGPIGVAGVYGLATGPDGHLYGITTTILFRINPETAAASNAVSLTGYALGAAYGLACRCGP